MSSTSISCDVAVIGGGISGMIAGLRAAQGGKVVRVFEKTPDERYVCNSRLTGGIWHCGQMDIQSDPAVLEERIRQVTGDNARSDLARAVAKDGIRVVRWMQSIGIRFIRGPYDYQSFMLSPPTITPQGRQWEGRGGDVMLRTFESALSKLGGAVLRGRRAVNLITEDDAVVGFTGTESDGTDFVVKAKAVVIADGGFQTNEDDILGVISPNPEKVFQRNARTGMGDGMRMAQKVGAGVSDLRGLYGHVLSKDCFTSDKLWPYAWLDFVLAAGIVVGKDGRRFADEGEGGVHMANCIAGLADPSSAVVIADQTIWEERGTFNILPPNPRLAEGGGTIHKAPTLEGLAELAGLDAIGLRSQVEQYNAAISTDTLGKLDPLRTTAKFKAYPIVTSPFYAFPAAAGITYTMGGISIDHYGRVLDRAGIPMQGLYAVGCATGGLEGGEKKGYVGGLVKSSVTGLRAAEHIIGEVID
jgi:fumarate reductase flavoprotein subunit